MVLWSAIKDDVGFCYDLSIRIFFPELLFFKCLREMVKK